MAAIEIEMERMDCPLCGITFFMPEVLTRRMRGKDPKGVRCPGCGRTLVYVGQDDPKVTQLKHDLEQAEAKVAELNEKLSTNGKPSTRRSPLAKSRALKPDDASV